MAVQPAIKNPTLGQMPAEKRSNLADLSKLFELDWENAKVYTGADAAGIHAQYFAESAKVESALAAKVAVNPFPRTPECELNEGDMVVFKCTRESDKKRQVAQEITSIIPISYGRTGWACMIQGLHGSTPIRGPFPSEVLEPAPPDFY